MRYGYAVVLTRVNSNLEPPKRAEYSRGTLSEVGTRISIFSGLQLDPRSYKCGSLQQLGRHRDLRRARVIAWVASFLFHRSMGLRNSLPLLPGGQGNPDSGSRSLVQVLLHALRRYQVCYPVILSGEEIQHRPWRGPPHFLRESRR